MSAELLPTKSDEFFPFVNLWSRESALLGAGLYISAEDTDVTAKKNVIRLIENGFTGPLFLGTLDRWPTLNRSLEVSKLTLEVSKPSKSEQKQIWNHYLKEYNTNNTNSLENEVGKIVTHFDLNPSSIESAVLDSILSVRDERNGIDLMPEIWKYGRIAAGRKMNELALHIIPKAKEEDLILPEKQKLILHNIMIHTMHKEKVYTEWGFADINSRGLGISALFAGGSGTGKTMAAEVLANKLDLDLFRIDLSMVVNKYIGETEKNLRQVFDAAEDGGAILFFDEADALFGKRSEVRDSHDRYANIEVSYLLQRMENYRGLAILATNMKDALDPAFLRRIRFVVNFPFPDERGREEIWKRVFPRQTPKGDIRFDILAKLHITGGSIHNIAMYASFLAAENNVPVNMEHIKKAIYIEYDKLERPLDVVELADRSL
jgi:AAA+ superfamily predicted ATPase